MTDLFLKAVRQADKVRSELGLNIFEPVNIIDACLQLKVRVRYLDINMEGMYVGQENGNHPTILLSSQRPLPRRSFTCAHELGHHSFSHGTRLDALSDSVGHASSKDKNEILVDMFAGALLMPIAGIQAEFAKRNLDSEKATPIQFYVISSFFGTGYETLIVHCRANRLISEQKEKQLRKYTPGKILNSVFGPAISNSHFKIIDGDSEVSLVDLEVSNYIILPPNSTIEGDHLIKEKKTDIGTGYRAVQPGILRIQMENGKGSFVRIQRSSYVGLAENRFLENEES